MVALRFDLARDVWGFLPSGYPLFRLLCARTAFALRAALSSH